MEGNFHFILHGHEHDPKVKIIAGTSGECALIPAGAVYDRRIAIDPRYINAYNFVHLNTETGKGTVYLRHWSDKSDKWLEDIDTHPGGEFPFELKNLRKHKPSRKSASRQIPLISTSEDDLRLQAVEQRYRELMLETCDIVNLASLPVQDPQIAQKQQELRLRGLYIPLRVRVEQETGDEIDQEKTDSWFQELEDRRAAAQSGKSTEKRVHNEQQRLPIGERLGSAKRLVILGDPGAGKTTLTRWIATAYLLRLKQDPAWRGLLDVKTLPEVDWLPIIIRCRDLDQNCLNGSFDDILRYTLRKAELRESESADLLTILRQRLTNGQALLMLDGMDEINDPTARACFCQQLEQFVVAYSKAPIIATSRIVGYREMGYKLGRGFEHLTLDNLTPEEKDDFITRWCAFTEVPERKQDATKELIHDIHSSERIERLTGNPMLLTTMALVKRKVGKLPNRRADLYREAVQVLLNWRPDTGKPIDWYEAIPQLGFVAYSMCDRGVQQLRKDEILELLVQMRTEYPNLYAVRNRSPEEFLQRLEARTGILVEAGYVHHLGMLIPAYEFRHLTFQEYLAARGLVDKCFSGCDPRRSLAEQVAPLAGRTAEMAFTEKGLPEVAVVESWREALRLCIAICDNNDVDSILQAILTSQPNEAPPIGRARAILAALCLADEPNASPAMVERVFAALAQQAKTPDGDGLLRTGMELAVIELAPSRWGEMLRMTMITEFCNHASELRGVFGGLASTIIGTEIMRDEVRLPDWLVEQVRRIRDGNEPNAIVGALGLMHVAYSKKAQIIPDMVNALLARLNNSNSQPMEHAAAWALSWLNGGVRDNGIWQPNPDEIDMLLKYISNPMADSEAVYFLSWILKKEETIASVKAQGENKRLTTATQIIAGLKHGNSKTRSNLGSLLGKISGETAIVPIIACLDNTDENIRRAVVDALGQIGSETAITPLLAHLNDADENVRLAVINTLGQIGSETAITPLLAHLNDADENVRFAVVNALGQIGNENAVAALIPRLDDTNEEVRRAVVGVFVQQMEEKDRILLSRDLDGVHPFIDPQELINEKRVEDVSIKLEISIKDLRARYEALAERFHLNLAWWLHK